MIKLSEGRPKYAHFREMSSLCRFKTYSSLRNAVFTSTRTHACMQTYTRTHTALLVEMETQAEIRGSESGMGPSGITSRLSCSSEMFEEVK